ncbi:DNA repair exonuclease [bacterium]|nr:DNA repair exonuclease [bacterium]
MIRFIHAADIHLDSLMKGIRSESAGIDPAAFRLSTRHALRNLVDWAIREKVDFVTLGGDNFDGDWKDFTTGLYFNSEMARLTESGIPVVSISGNHDAASQISRSLNWPNRFRKLDDHSPEVYEPVEGVRVIGQGFRTKAVTENLAARYPANDSATGIMIGLLHTSLAGVPRDGHDNYAPCELADLRSKRYHFWGLGHIHKSSWMEGPGDMPILYPGNLQGRHIRETGPKGAWLIALNDDGSKFEQRFEALDTTRWELVIVDVTGVSNIDDCWAAVGDAISTAAQDLSNRFLAARIRFVGHSQVHQSLRKLLERADEALLACCRNEAARTCPGRVWIEAVELNSTAPASSRMSADSMLELRTFIDDRAKSDEWIADFLAKDEIQKLRKQFDYFENDSERGELIDILNPDAIRDVIEEIPEILESRLDIATSAEVED